MHSDAHMDLDDPTFPPLLDGFAVDAGDDPFARACTEAGARRAGGGDVFWSRSHERFQVAIVLEPDVPAAEAMHMHFLSMVAFGDAFGALGPPEVGMFYGWPDRFIVNAACVGRARAGLPAAAAPDAVPDWVVTGVDIALRNPRKGLEPGHDLENTTLAEEGCADLQRTHLVDSFCRHFLVWVHSWEEDGFREIHDMWMGRALGKGEQTGVTLAGARHSGTFLGLDEMGNLLLKSGTDTASLPILDFAERIG
jgi:BirA family biotin operon repressor/biotin-[acetyl-CoA-carboxylase] ligase